MDNPQPTGISPDVVEGIKNAVVQAVTNAGGSALAASPPAPGGGSESRHTPLADPTQTGILAHVGGSIDINVKINDVWYTLKLYLPDANKELGFQILDGTNVIAGFTFKDKDNWQVSLAYTHGTVTQLAPPIA